MYSYIYIHPYADSQPKNKIIGFLRASVFLAFTNPLKGDGEMIIRGFYLDFVFSENQKALLDFRNQIGSVLRWNFRHYKVFEENDHVTGYVVFLVQLFSLRNS